jgi:hypothetical protein
VLSPFEKDLAIRIYKKHPDEFDPAIDKIVRVELRDLRYRLDQFYRSGGKTTPVRLTINRNYQAVAQYAELYESTPLPKHIFRVQVNDFTFVAPAPILEALRKCGERQLMFSRVGFNSLTGLNLVMPGGTPLSGSVGRDPRYEEFVFHVRPVCRLPRALGILGLALDTPLEAVDQDILDLVDWNISEEDRSSSFLQPDGKIEIPLRVRRALDIPATGEWFLVGYPLTDRQGDSKEPLLDCDFMLIRKHEWDFLQRSLASTEQPSPWSSDIWEA